MDVSALYANGWAVGCLSSSSTGDVCRELIALASSIGKPVADRRGVAIIDTLRPVTAERARPNSLSARFSVGEFPCHTDMANVPTPCRFIVLACLSPGDGRRPTTLLDPAPLSLTYEDRDLIHTTPFRVVNGRHSFFSTIMRRGRPFVRFDPGCMQPVTSDGERASKVLGSGDWRLASVQWERGRVLVIDNWRILHGRGLAMRDDRDRVLLRIYINERAI